MNASHQNIVPKPYLQLVKSLGIDLTNIKKKSKPQLVSVQPVAQSDHIIESYRNNTLARIAGSLRRTGMDEAALDAALQQVNQTRCVPPLSGHEVSTIAKSIASYAASNPDNILETLTDTGNAERFHQRFKDLVRFVPEWKTWLIWDGGCWVKDRSKQIVEMAKSIARDIYLEGSNIADQSVRNKINQHSGKSQQEPRLLAMMSLAESISGLIAHASSLDLKPHLLCVQNGVIDLNTGKLGQANPHDLITQRSPIVFDAKAKCPEFLAFVKRIMGREKDLIDYLQRAFGYVLTGYTTEQCLFFLYGSGANGKSTLLNVLAELLGTDYSKQTPSETLMVKFNGRNATNDLARLQGCRAVVANEVEGGAHLAESMIKQLTGGDPISARYLYSEFFEFKPVFKLLIAGNHKPVIRGDDHGIWRRIQLVPFEVTIPEAARDHKLAEKLIAELPGILNWALLGCKQWQKVGLSVPTIITDAVSEYRKDMDIIGHWLEDAAGEIPPAEWGASEAYFSYSSWAKNNGFKPITSTAFGRKLSERFPKKKTAKGIFYQGVTVKSPPAR